MYEIKDKMKQIEMEEDLQNIAILSAVVVVIVTCLAVFIFAAGEAHKKANPQKVEVNFDKPYYKWLEGCGRGEKCDDR